MADENGAPNLDSDKVKAFQKNAFGSDKEDEKKKKPDSEGVFAAMKRRLMASSNP